MLGDHNARPLSHEEEINQEINELTVRIKDDQYARTCALEELELAKEKVKEYEEDICWAENRIAELRISKGEK